MPERLCDLPKVVEASDGRATCPDRFYSGHFLKDDCNNCPKTRSNTNTKPPKSKADRDHWEVLKPGGMRYS